MNVLISCAGRRSDLVSYFRQLPQVSQVHCCDMDIHAPSWELADFGHLTPRFTDPAYVPRFRQICEKYRIDLALTLNDFELPILAANKAALQALGTTVVVSDPRVIDICLDKLRTRQFFAEHGFDRAESFDQKDRIADSDFPLIVKPRFGTGSIGVEIANNADELDIVLAYSKLQVSRSAIVRHFDGGDDLLIEKRVDGVEYAIDVINDLQGRYRGCVVKRKLAKRGGDAALVISEQEPRLEDWARRLSAQLGHVGNLDCDVFMDDDHIYCVDLNPRFGGAYPFSHLAGINLPELLVKWASGDDPPVHLDAEPGVVVVRTESYVRLENFRRILHKD